MQVFADADKKISDMDDNLIFVTWWKFFWMSFLENQRIPEMFPIIPKMPTST